jgi:hypothetical protein
MQPYFLPYIGYFQLMQASDRFVIYDNIQYTKKGWINRNRILQNGQPVYISLPLRSDSDFLFISQRVLADNHPETAATNLRKVGALYRKAPQFEPVYALLERIYAFDEANLFAFILNSLEEICAYLNIEPGFVVSSTLSVDPALKAETRVIANCHALEAATYINPIGGVSLYNYDRFRENGIRLRFLKANPITYEQFGTTFVPSLSILDVMMFNPVDRIKQFLDHEYTFLEEA